MQFAIRNPKSEMGFTLIELMVVVVVIVILIAILVPALDKARDKALNATCLVNTRSVVQNCMLYAMESDNALPPYKVNGAEADAYDMRAASNPANTGLLVGKYLPSTKLGKMVHCPVLDNMAGPIPGHCMDVIRGDPANPDSIGASWWVDAQYSSKRVIAGYNYRSHSYAKSAEGGPFRTHKLGTGFVLYVDIFDIRFRGESGKYYAHTDGYNRAFADGSAAWFYDPIDPSTGRGNVEKLVKDNGGAADGRGAADEKVYKYMSVDRNGAKP